MIIETWLATRTLRPTSTMSNADTMTDDEIDELALDIETKIQENTQFLEELDDFDPKYRRMEEAEDVDLFA